MLNEIIVGCLYFRSFICSLSLISIIVHYLLQSLTILASTILWHTFAEVQACCAGYESRGRCIFWETTFHCLSSEPCWASHFYFSCDDHLFVSHVLWKWQLCCCFWSFSLAKHMSSTAWAIYVYKTHNMFFIVFFIVANEASSCTPIASSIFSLTCCKFLSTESIPPFLVFGSSGILLLFFASHLSAFSWTRKTILSGCCWHIQSENTCQCIPHRAALLFFKVAYRLTHY